MENKIKTIIIFYQLICAIIGSLLLIYVSLFNEFALVNIVGFVFNVIVIIGCIKYYKHGKNKLFILTQYFQIIGVGILGLYIFMHPGVFCGPVFAYDNGSVLFEFNVTLPEYAFTFIRYIDSFNISVNLIPIFIIYSIKTIESELAKTQMIK